MSAPQTRWPRVAAPAGDPDDRLVIEDAAVQRLLDLAADRGKVLRWVVVDDLDVDGCELAISPWPSRREDGRVWFGRSEEDHMIAELPVAQLHETVVAARASQFAGEAVPDFVRRPLRVGDTFAALVDLPDQGDPAPPGGHRAEIAIEEIADVTLAARELTKIQVAVAEARPVDQELLAGLHDEEA